VKPPSFRARDTAEEPLSRAQFQPRIQTSPKRQVGTLIGTPPALSREMDDCTVQMVARPAKIVQSGESGKVVFFAEEFGFQEGTSGET